jgi:hypothetical protein
LINFFDKKGITFKTAHGYVERIFKYANSKPQLKQHAKSLEFFVSKLNKHVKNDGKGGFFDKLASVGDAINPFSDEPQNKG